MAAALLMPVLTAAPAATPKATPESVARRIQVRLETLRGVQARFTQTLESAALPSAQKEEGTVYLQRPGRMRWEYRVPPGKLAVADGARSWLYLPEDRRVLITPMEGLARDQGMGWLLADHLDLLATFEPAWGGARRPDGTRALVLHPRRKAGAYERLIVEPDASGFPVVLTIIDPLGGSVTYRFDDLRFTDQIDPALFRFDPPPGVEVQEMTP